MKIILVNKNGAESLICESVNEFHGRLIVSLLNQNFATRHKKELYKMVEMSYRMD